MPQEIKIPLDFQNVGTIINLPDGEQPQDAATVHQLNELEATIGGNINGSGKYLIAGGAVWSGTGLTYNVSYISYYWNGDQLANPTSITLAASDPTNNRLDALVVSEAGVISVITGSPSSSPITPAIPEDQLLIQFILVEAGSTVPSVTQENIYLDNAQWTFANYTISGTQVGTSNPDATDSPKEGTKCIDNNLDPRTGIRFSRATSLDITPYTTLEVWVRYPVAMANAEALYVQFENTSFAAIGSRVDLFNYGLQKNVVNTWQLALVPLSAFGVTTVQGFRMILSGGKNNVLIEWDVDFITILNGSAPIVTSPTINFYENSTLIASQKGLDIVPGTGMGITAVQDAVKQTVKYTLTPDTNKAYVDAADAALLSDIGAKEDTITPGTTSQYWRGDKTWQAFDSAVLASSLAGLSITGGAVTSDDNVLAAFGKLQNQINGILGGATYQGVWNATTNSPALASGVGTKGYYYVVSVNGSTNLDGITDWKVGDWAIFNGTTWDKVDNTDAVSSVNGAIGAISLAGTADRISVTGTTFDIASTYAGQSSINTVGTVTAGAWQATPIAAAYGGVPSGGTINQVLTKVSGASYDYAWADATGGGGSGIYAGSGTPFTTYAKGDLIYASDIDTLSRLAADTDNKVLTMISGLPVWSASGVSWSRSGNAGTVAGTDFLGTTDNIDFVIKRNNIQYMRLWSSSVFMGNNAGASVTTPSNNNFFGNTAGSGATSAASCNFFGNGAGLNSGASNSNFFGSTAGNASNASNSNFFGNNAGASATSAINSNFFGPAAGQNASGANNANFFGSSSGFGATGAIYSNFFGANAGQSASNAPYSNFFGRQAGYLATNAGFSNFLGQFAGYGATGASFSTFMGYHVGYNATFAITGTNNIVIGTNITTPAATSSNIFNIGNVLYGVNCYSTTSGNPSATAQTTGRVSIGTTTADASAILDLTSTTMGLLAPRMTTTQKSAIAAPAEGLIVYDTSLHKLSLYTGSAWETITST